MMKLRVVWLAGLLALAGGPAASQDAVRVGYWASGVSAGIGLVLEEGKFLEQENLRPQWVHFTRLADVNRAVISKSIDIAVAGGTIPTLRLGAEGVPAKVILANLVADANFVVLDRSPIRAMTDLKGKKIGSTPPGSTAHALVSTVLQRSYGLAPAEYQQIPSSETQLAVLLARGEIDAALMRTITYRMVGAEPKLRVLSTIPQEWKSMIKADSPPVLGLAVVDEGFAKAKPDAVVRYLVAAMKATRWGGENPDKVAEMLKRRLNMAENEARAYAGSWKDIYFASLEESDITSLMTMVDVFKSVESFPGEVTRDVFLVEPYRQAKQRLGR